MYKQKRKKVQKQQQINGFVINQHPTQQTKWRNKKKKKTKHEKQSIQRHQNQKTKKPKKQKNKEQKNTDKKDDTPKDQQRDLVKLSSHLQTMTVCGMRYGSWFHQTRTIQLQYNANETNSWFFSILYISTMKAVDYSRYIYTL